jgi:threonine/homoserine/homoserine lactone efflux protein
VLKYVGVAYLAFLSFQTLIELRKVAGKFDLNGEAQVGGLAAYRLGLFTNLTNVKATVFAVAFIPQFVPRTFSLTTGILVLGFVHVGVSTAWYFSLVAGVDRAATVLARPQVRRWLTAVSALGLLLLAIILLFSSAR